MITQLLLVLCVRYSLGADILAVLPTPSYSHQIAYTHIWKELSLRGHKVTLITTDPLKDPKLTNLTEIDMKWTYKLGETTDKNGPHLLLTMWNFHKMSDSFTWQVTEKQLSQPEVQNLIHNKSNFDVVLVEFLYPELLAFAEIYKCPKILIASLDAFSIVHHSVGNTVHPVLYPEIGATFYGSLNFKERVTSMLYTWYVMYFYSYISFTKKNNLVTKYFNVSKTVQELVNDVDLLFLNVNPILQPIRAVGPSTITIGGDRAIVSSKLLPDDISEFLESAVDGFVYFSLGSNVKSKDLSQDMLEDITGALSELPFKVLWKFEADEFPNKPDNVKLIKWAPQQTVLAHRNIKVFVTQGGLQSTEEAFYRGVPLVVIPFFGDQEQNAKIMESKGIAVMMNRIPSIKKEELKRAILEVANNLKYDLLFKTKIPGPPDVTYFLKDKL